MPNFTRHEQPQDRVHEHTDDTTKLLLQKLLHNEISEDTFTLALETLNRQKPENKKTHEMGYHY